MRLPRHASIAAVSIIAVGHQTLFLGPWQLDYPDIDNVLGPTFHSRNIPRLGNQVRFSDPEADRLLEGEMEGHADRRVEIFQQAENRINGLSPWIPLFHQRACHIVQPGVNGCATKEIYNAERFPGVTKSPRTGLSTGRRGAR